MTRPRRSVAGGELRRHVRASEHEPQEQQSDALEPAKGIGIISPVGVQWKPGSTDLVGHHKYAWSQWVVDNSLNKHIPINGTLEPPTFRSSLHAVAPTGRCL